MSGTSPALCALAPVGLLAELTHRCPLQCSYCSNPLELERVNKELTTAEWVSVMEQAGAMGILQVHLSGGEPTARKDLEDIVSAASKAGLYTNLITAAVTLTRPRLEELVKRGLDHVQISFQDVDAENAERIGAYPGATQKKLDVARWVTELGLPLTINAPIHRQNIHNVPRYIELALKLGAQRLEIAHVQYYGWAYLNRAALIPTYEQTIESIEFVERERERLKGVLTIDMVVPDYYAKRPKPCMGGWGKGFMNITPAGKVLPCHAAETIKHLSFDNVKDRKLLDIWLNSDAFNAFRGTEWMKEPCRSCAFKRDRLGRMPLPSHGHHRRCPQHRSGLRALALSRRDGGACPRRGGKRAAGLRLSQPAERPERGEARTAPLGSGGIACRQSACHDQAARFSGPLVFERGASS